MTINEAAENVLVENITETNMQKIQSNKIKYEEFIRKILDFIFDVEYSALVNFLQKNILDNDSSIKKCATLLLDLYLSNKKEYRNQNIKDNYQKIIFWHTRNGEIRSFFSKYPLCSLSRYKAGILLLYKNKNNGKLPLATIIDENGVELYNIDFPLASINECIDQNIECYFGSIDDYGHEVYIVFVNGKCRFDFWCLYSIADGKYIDTNCWK